MISAVGSSPAFGNVAGEAVPVLREHTDGTQVSTRTESKSHNTTLAALGESSGTLLEMRDIVIADEPDQPVSSRAAAAKKDDQASTTAFETVRLAPSAVPLIQVLPELEPKAEDRATGTKPFDQNDNEVLFSFSLGGFKCEVSVAKP